MKKTIFFISAIFAAGALFAQQDTLTMENTFKKVKQLSVNTLGGTLDIALSPDKKTTSVKVDIPSAQLCRAVMSQEKGVLTVKVKQASPDAKCGSDIKITVPASVEIEVTAQNTRATIGSFTKSIKLDVRNSIFSIDNATGRLGVENMLSNVTAVGVFKPVTIDSANGTTIVKWTQKTKYDITIDGTGEIIFTVPPETQTLPVRNTFNGTFMINNN